MNEEDNVEIEAVAPVEDIEAQEIVSRLEYNQPSEEYNREIGERVSTFYNLVSPEMNTNTSEPTEQTYTSKSVDDNRPRNVRNNNLGNIKHNKNNDWQGQRSTTNDKTFVDFDTPEYGIRALKKVINANIRATDSIETYVNRYASEPNEKAYYRKNGKLMPHLQNYAKTIASSQGIKDIRTMPKNVNMKRWIKATAVAEGGGKALRYYTDAIIDRGINMR